MGPQRDEEGHLIQFRGAGDSPECHHCPCAVNGKPGIAVRAFGATGGLAVVGEGPGSEEVFQRYPFIGPSGKLLDRALVGSGIDRNLLWITNALLCPRPREEALFDKAVSCCRPRLQEELRASGVTAVIALGGTAMRALELPVSTVMEARGTVQLSPAVPGTPVFATMHPAALLRGGAGDVSGGKNKQNVDAQMLFFQADVDKAYRVAIGALAPTWSDDIDVYVSPPVVEVPAAAPETAAPSTPATPPPAPPVGHVKDPITEIVKLGATQAFIDFYVKNPIVWQVLNETYVKSKTMKNVTSDMLWGVTVWNLDKEHKFRINDVHKPMYLRLLKTMEVGE